MRLGLSSFTYPWAVGIPGHPPTVPLTASDLVDRAIELEVGVVQFGDNLPLHRLSADEFDALERRTRETGIAVEVGTRGIGPNLVEYVTIAARLGSPFVRVVVDSPGDEPTVDEVVHRLSEHRRAFTDLGLNLAIENHDRLPADAFVDIVERLGDWAGICLDTVNSLGCLEAPEYVASVLGPHAINLHLKDFVIRRHGSQLGFEVVGTPAGAGMLDIPRLIETVSRSMRVHSAILELWVPPQGSLESTISTESAWATESVRWLRAATALA